MGRESAQAVWRAIEASRSAKPGLCRPERINFRCAIGFPGRNGRLQTSANGSPGAGVHSRRGEPSRGQEERRGARRFKTKSDSASRFSRANPRISCSKAFSKKSALPRGAALFVSPRANLPTALPASSPSRAARLQRRGCRGRAGCEWRGSEVRWQGHRRWRWRACRR